MKRIIFLAFITIVAFSSCNKNDDNNDPIPQETVLEYLPLAIGNYWVYEKSSCDSTWTGCTSMSIDTNVVTKDTTINELHYFKIEGRNLMGSEPKFVRDSLDYIIDSEGRILFSNKDFTTIFHEEYVVPNNDTLYHWYTKMDEVPIIFEVPLGNFTCLDNKLSFFRKKENFEYEFNSHSSYAKDIGLVYESAMFASSTGGIKRELIGTNILEIGE